MKITNAHTTVIATLGDNETFTRSKLSEMKLELQKKGFEPADDFYHATVNPVQANDFLNFGSMKEPVYLDGVKITINPAFEAGIVTLFV